MNILYISQALPYFPCYDGFRLIPYNMIKWLSKEHSIYLISFKNRDDNTSNENEIKKYCKTVETVTTKNSKSILNLLKNLVLPYEWNNEMSNRITHALKINKFDVIHAEGMNVAQYVSKISYLPKIVSPHDVFSEKAFQFINGERRAKGKLLYIIQWLKSMHFERTVYKKFDCCVVVGPKDQQILQHNLPNLPIEIIPNGVDVEYYKFKPQETDNNNLIFTGSLTFPPNIDAVLYFYKNIFPLITKRINDAKFYIVGANPTKEILDLRKDNRVIVTGLVDDLRTFIYKSCVYICPMRLGMGIKNKILEAMALGIPIVATNLSTIGINITNEKDITIADEPNSFASAVIDLLINKEKRLKLAREARKLVEDQYSWESKAKLLESIYKTAIDKHRVNVS